MTQLFVDFLEGRGMSFREKSAWIMLSALALASFFYAGTLVSIWQSGGPIAPVIPLIFVVYVLVICVVAIIGHIIAALCDTQGVDEPTDERDLAIAGRAARTASMVTSFGLFITMSLVFLGANAEQIVNGILAAMTLGQSTEYATQIIRYRRGV